MEDFLKNHEAEFIKLTHRRKIDTEEVAELRSQLETERRKVITILEQK